MTDTAVLDAATPLCLLDNEPGVDRAAQVLARCVVGDELVDVGIVTVRP